MAGEKPSKGTYETFDSGEGPVVPDGMESDFAHADDGEGSYCQNEADMEQGAVPSAPKK